VPLEIAGMRTFSELWSTLLLLVDRTALRLLDADPQQVARITGTSGRNALNLQMFAPDNR